MTKLYLSSVIFSQSDTSKHVNYVEIQKLKADRRIVSGGLTRYIM